MPIKYDVTKDLRFLQGYEEGLNEAYNELFLVLELFIKNTYSIQEIAEKTQLPVAIVLNWEERFKEHGLLG